MKFPVLHTESPGWDSWKRNNFGISAQNRQNSWIFWESPGAKKSAFLFLPLQIFMAPKNSGCLCWADRAWEFHCNNLFRWLFPLGNNFSGHWKRELSLIVSVFTLIMQSFHCFLPAVTHRINRVKQNLTHNTSHLATILLFTSSEDQGCLSVIFLGGGKFSTVVPGLGFYSTLSLEVINNSSTGCRW